MKKIIKGIATIALATFSLSAYAADIKPQATSAAQTEPKINVKRTPEEKIGSWYYYCETLQVDGKDRPQVCGMLQNFTALNKEKKPTMLLLNLQIIKLTDKDKKITLMQLNAPLGINLLAGLKLKIAGKDYKTIPFALCELNSGCRSSLKIEGELEVALKASKDLKVEYIIANGQPVTLDVKTDGYTKAIAKF